MRISYLKSRPLGEHEITALAYQSEGFLFEGEGMALLATPQDKMDGITTKLPHIITFRSPCCLAELKSKGTGNSKSKFYLCCGECGQKLFSYEIGYFNSLMGELDADKIPLEQGLIVLLEGWNSRMGANPVLSALDAKEMAIAIPELLARYQTMSKFRRKRLVKEFPSPSSPIVTASLTL